MSSFTFNFALDGSDGDRANETNAFQPVVATGTPMRKGEEVGVPPGVQATQGGFMSIQLGDGSTMDIVDTASEQFQQRTGELAQIVQTSDIESGVYEGGLKVWEASLDLVRYMKQQGMAMPEHVLELGCGHGIPGIYALRQGARSVTFSDYNREVLELATIPNVMRNSSDAQASSCRFYAGDWGSVSALGQIPPAELILTAETIYTESVTLACYEAIKRHLHQSPSSVALVAAKKYYFGTGGSVQHLLQVVQQDNMFSAEIVHETADGRSNIRQIVCLRYKEAFVN